MLVERKKSLKRAERLPGNEERTVDMSLAKVIMAGGIAMFVEAAAAGSCIVSGSTERDFGVSSRSVFVTSDVRTCSAKATADNALTPFDSRIFTMDWLNIELFNSFPMMGLLLRFY